jgi:hypothetical protein
MGLWNSVKLDRFQPEICVWRDSALPCVETAGSSRNCLDIIGLFWYLKHQLLAVRHVSCWLSLLGTAHVRGWVQKFPVWPTFKGDRNKTTLLFFNIVSLYFNTYRYWYMNLTIDDAIYPSQYFPFGAAFVCQAGNFWTHPRKMVAKCVYCVVSVRTLGYILYIRNCFGRFRLNLMFRVFTVVVVRGTDNVTKWNV